MHTKSTTVAYLFEASAMPDQPRELRPFERIAQELAEQVRNGRIVRGQKLPTEREMCTHFGVSRSVIREAVKLLDAMGLVESRQGSGIYVRNNPIPMISRALTLSVTPEDHSLATLFEFRTVLESAAVEYAALRRTPDDIERINAAAAVTADVALRQDGPAWHETDALFHRAISDASGNAYLSVAIVAVRQMQQSITTFFKELPGSPGAVAQHFSIAEAIAMGLPDEAVRRMRAHIAYSAEQLHNAREPTRSMEVQ